MWNYLEGWVPGCFQQLFLRDETLRRMTSHVLPMYVLHMYVQCLRNFKWVSGLLLQNKQIQKGLNIQLCFTGLSQSEFKSQDNIGDFHIGFPSNSKVFVLVRFLLL